jgi:RND family efflux transporter MFP subunit
VRAWYKGRAYVVAAVIVAAVVVAWFVVVPAIRPASGTTRWATGTAAVGTIRVSVSGSGALQPGRAEDLRATSAGKVRRVLAANGQNITAGQVLVELENEAVLLAWEQAGLTYQAESEKLQQMLAGGGTRETALRTAELRVEQARLNLEARQKAFDDLTLRARNPGLAAGVDLRPGDEVAAGAVLMTIVETGKGRARINVGEDRVGSLRVGGRASVLLAPLPEAHTFKVKLGEATVAGINVGDRADVTIDGRWLAGGITAIFQGAVAEVRSAGTAFDVTCRVPGLPGTVPTGASASHVSIYPSGKPPGTVVTAAGTAMTVTTDTWGMDDAHVAGRGLPGRIVSIAGQGVRATGTGPVTFAVVVELDSPAAGARAGMTAHAAVWPADGGALMSDLSTLELPLTRVVTAAGGIVLRVGVRDGDPVTAGQALVEFDNQTVRYQLEHARNELAVQTASLNDLQRPASADREQRAQEIKVRQAELAMEARAADAAGLRIVAPVSGRVSGWNANLTPGRDVVVGTQICRVLNYDAMSLVVQVDELEVDRIYPGMPAQLTVDALPGQQFTGHVAEVSPEGVFQQGVSRFAVTIAIEPSPRLRSQMTAVATIFVTEKEGALLVPAEAVVFLDPGQGEVSVLGSGGAVEVRKVGIGLTNSKHCEITSGLSAGERVITGVVTNSTNPLDWRNPRTGTLPR